MSYHGFSDKASFDKALDAHITREQFIPPCEECGGRDGECTEDCCCESCTEELANNQETKNDID